MFRRFSQLTGAIILVLLSLHTARTARAQAVVVFDALTGVSSYTYNSATPRNAIGQVFNLGNTASTSPTRITGTDFSITSTVAQTAANITVVQYFWGTSSLATTGTTAAFSNLIASRTYSLGTQTFTANSVNTFSGTFGTAVNLGTATQIGFSEVVLVNGVANSTVIPLLTTYPTTPAVGSNALSFSGLSAFYQNISATSGNTGNFIGSDARAFTGTNSYLAVRLNSVAAAAPEPGSLGLMAGALLPIAGVIARRRHRNG